MGYVEHRCGECRHWRRPAGGVSENDAPGRCEFPMPLPEWAVQSLPEPETESFDGQDCATFSKGSPQG